MNEIKRDAVISENEEYRYWLKRSWNESLPSMGFIMLNPSTADAYVDDPTIRRCIGFAVREGCGSIEVVNLAALRTPYPEYLKTMQYNGKDIVGAENRRYVDLVLNSCAIVIAAWGSSIFKVDLGSEIGHLVLSRKLIHCFGLTATGQPRHPLYLPKDVEICMYLGGKL